jgi:hypothetical protein
MLTAVLQIIDRLIQLETRREQVKRNRYSDFFAPLMADLDAVHKDYTESFKRYQTILDDDTIPLTNEHPVFKDVASDNLLSEHLRAKIQAVDFDNLAQPGNEVEKAFLRAIYDYLFRSTLEPTSRVQYAEVRPAEYFLTDAEHSALRAEAPDFYTPDWEDPIDELRGIRDVQIHRTEAALGMLELLAMKVTDGDKRKLAERILSEGIYRLQCRYREVVGAHQALKQQLLRPR